MVTPAREEVAPVDGLTALHGACAAGDDTRVASLLTAGAPVDETDVDGITPLHFAAARGYDACVRLLLARRADVNREAWKGYTALNLAARAGRASSVRILLLHGARIDQLPAGGIGGTALIEACGHGHETVVGLLLDHRADVHVEDRAGSNALDWAAGLGYAQIARRLLDAGADLSPRGARAEPLYRACLFNHLEVTRLLVAHGATRPGEGQLSISLPRNEATDWLRETRLWCTPLHHLELLSEPRVRALLRAGADVHARAPPPPPRRGGGERERERERPQTASAGAARRGGATPDAEAPTPLSIAREVVSRTPTHAAARAVLAAAAPWSPGTHQLFPAAARARAVQLLVVGHELAAELEERLEEEGEDGAAQAAMALLDVWRAHVLPHAVLRADFLPTPLPPPSAAPTAPAAAAAPHDDGPSAALVRAGPEVEAGAARDTDAGMLQAARSDGVRPRTQPGALPRRRSA